MHALLNPSIWEAEAGRVLSSKPAWSKELFPGQLRLHSKTLSRKTKQQQHKLFKNCFLGLEDGAVKLGALVDFISGFDF